MRDDEKPVAINVFELWDEREIIGHGDAGATHGMLVSVYAPLNGYSLPGDPREIAHLCRYPWSKFKRRWPRIEPFWPLGPDGRRYHAGLLRWQRDYASEGELREHVH